MNSLFGVALQFGDFYMREKQGFVETSSVKSKPERSKADFYSTLSISCLIENYNTFLETSQAFLKIL